MKNKYVMSRLLALGMAATLTAGNLPMVANAADETVKVSAATEQKAEDTEVETQETENPQAENVEQFVYNFGINTSPIEKVILNLE